MKSRRSGHRSLAFAAVLLTFLLAAQAIAVQPVATQAGRHHRKGVKFRIGMPPPHRTRTARVTFRVAKNLHRFHIQMYIRRNDGRYSAPVEVGEKAVIKDGRKRLARISFAARYSPRRGKFRCTVSLKNLRVSRRVYRAASVSVAIVVHYTR